MSANLTVLFRPDYHTQTELETAKQHLPVVTQRGALPKNSTVVGRYSVLPFYYELEQDLQLLGSRMLVTTTQHDWIASFDYYETIKEWTFPSWDYDAFIRLRPPGPYVVKGATNGRKDQWKTHMYAETFSDVVRIAGELHSDPLLRSQKIIVRKYTPLELIEKGINDQPFVNEWRFFYLNGRCLTRGFYWTQVENPPSFDPTAKRLADQIATKIKDFHPFPVIDIAMGQDGKWYVVELNDGQMSGLVGCNSDELYQGLALATGQS